MSTTADKTMNDLVEVFFGKEFTLAEELDQAIENGTFDKYVKRAEGEAGIFVFGESVNWDREEMIEYCLAGRSGWLGRKVFEKSFDDGSMKSHAETYYLALKKWDKQ